MAMNTSGKNQYENEIMSYTLPDSSAYQYKVGRYQTQWNKGKSQKMTYIDKIFYDSKKPERAVPGPNKYSPDKIHFDMPKEVSQKIGRDKRVSDIDRIFRDEKKRVAPNHYKDIDDAYK